MAHKTLRDCVNDLEKAGMLVRVKEEVDPNLEMASIHLRVFEANGPAIFFENIKGCQFPAVSNLFGTLDRSRFIFRNTLKNVEKLIEAKTDPFRVLNNFRKYSSVPFTAFNSLPKRTGNNPVLENTTSISRLPLIKCWPRDGGAFITLPQVYTEDIEKPGIMNSNLGMYRIQLNGNSYEPDKEIGLHYQLHRGIGVHQSKSDKTGKPLKVSIFIGGPPAHTFSAVMPLPEGLPEVTFAGALGGRRFHYANKDGYVISSDADFVITGEIYPNENKPEGPFGDHLGYYSLVHDFPVMRVHKVYHRKNPIWPFTVVGRPPQEDTAFGALIHEISAKALSEEIPGLHDVNAVDAAGVHPLLLAVGSERYTPYSNERRPQELLSISNHILGTGQMSLAKYLFIAAREDDSELKAGDVKKFFKHILERVDLTRDLHFQTRTTIDTLDYSGSGLNSGSKVVIACAGPRLRELDQKLPENFSLGGPFTDARIILPGIIGIKSSSYKDPVNTEREISILESLISTTEFKGTPLIVLVDDINFIAQSLNNFIWCTFTRSNPAADIFGVKSFIENKHWGCRGPLIIDSRIKPHHAPPLLKDPAIEKKVDGLGAKGKSLHGII